MRTFTIVWFGQLVSTIGSYMTEFALILWAWHLTKSATALALVGFFSQLPRIPISLVAGLIVDRYNRKHLMMLGDAIAALSTLVIGLLYLADSLQIWHLYLLAAISGGFGQIQSLAYSTSITLIVPKQHYTRANSMDSAIHYGSAIVAPALAGVLYPFVGFLGILLIDLVTFGMAIATLLLVHIPQPQPNPETDSETITQKLTFGIRYVFTQPGLRSLLIITTLFWFAHDLGEAVYDPMILARTNGSAQVLASVASAAGIGGVTGAIILSAWGGTKRRIHGMLAGFMGAGLSKTVFGFGQVPLVWIPAQFCSSLNFPLLGSSETAIWMEKIAPEIQGRVFAANALVVQSVSAIALLIAGPLADRVFEPALQQNNRLTSLFHAIVGTGAGAGISLLYILTSMTLVLIGLGGYVLPTLRRVED
ncbi:MAG: MFS transporter [Timaviella obliquedivisa GSE-PSE-MK23-08B]|nr:MFS transporter [Timaviella obliquedivisa GSE-PSE-MK23-08B]